MQWLANNWGTILIAVVVLAVVCGVVFHLIKRKKKGKCLGCDCCDCKSKCNQINAPQNNGFAE